MTIDIVPKVSQDANIKALLEENLRLTKAIYASSEKTRRYIFWGQVFGFLKIVIIVVPLVLAYWYLQPMLQQALSTYQQLLETSTAPSSTNSSLLNQLKTLQKSGQLNLPNVTK